MARRTWNDPGGPMVEPEHDPAIDAQVQQALAAIAAGGGPAGLALVAEQGRNVSNRMTWERATAEQATDRYQVAAADFAKELAVPPARDAIPRVLWRDAQDADRTTQHAQQESTEKGTQVAGQDKAEEAWSSVAAVADDGIPAAEHPGVTQAEAVEQLVAEGYDRDMAQQAVANYVDETSGASDLPTDLVTLDQPSVDEIRADAWVQAEDPDGYAAYDGQDQSDGDTGQGLPEKYEQDYSKEREAEAEDAGVDEDAGAAAAVAEAQAAVSSVDDAAASGQDPYDDADYDGDDRDHQDAQSDVYQETDSA